MGTAARPHPLRVAVMVKERTQVKRSVFVGHWKWSVEGSFSEGQEGTMLLHSVI